MAFLSLMISFAPLTLYFLLLPFVPHQVHASSHASFVTKYVTNDYSNVGGLCVSSIIVHGYKCQEHMVTTEDGYILGLQRIQEGRAEVNGIRAKKQPVILQHGVLVDSNSWFVNAPKQNLPFILADNGYDVWISNTRGTTFTRRHVSLDPSNREFWNWTWDELVAHDLPALFDYVSKETRQKINYIGHSHGTLIALTSFSEGKLVNQVKSAVLLSPVAYLSHMTTELGVVAARYFLDEVIHLIGLAEFDLRLPQVKAIIRSLCDSNPGINCYDLLNAITGPNCCLNSTTVTRFFKNEPQSTSTKNLVHFAQTFRNGVLTKFDYVLPSENYRHYGQLFPPRYTLSNIPHNIPLFLSYGGKDALSDVTDVQKLLDILKFHDADKLSVQFIKEYAHADFIMAINAKDIVYKHVLSFFSRHA
ncbi:PREDICTED: triacylglycerol lipase 2-like [Lupinus angustifolius]|uniref:triacylglycerol lipase 2-like n=1 Tax=Lupinus angustifolius TaxID=3871 RepID=UPI00092F01E1|nr:PREDICTED: triacylglycerol lipase 2-like [Lupinus angustifolius]